MTRPTIPRTRAATRPAAVPVAALTAFFAALSASLMMALATPAAAQVAQWQREFPLTDFSRSTVDLSEILSGGPPRDGIPALDSATVIPAADERRLEPREPVLTVAIDGAPPRAYPIRYLMWHEIVNDTVAGIPVAVTFCPLCNSGMVFDRRLDGDTLTFGVTGRLRHSDMVMYDHQTESWWQQAVGQGIVGHYAGRDLRALPAWMESWAEFRTANPDGLVMDQPDFSRAYGRNPYVSYDSSIRPFLYRGETPPHGIPPLARVVRVDDRAWPLERLREAGEITEEGLRLTWAEGQASALDTATIGAGREVGTVRVRDARGRDVAHDIPFAFAFHAFFPQGHWMVGD